MSSLNYELYDQCLEAREMAFRPRADAERAKTYLRRKGIVERAFAALLLLPILPLLGALVLLVRATSRGPAIFKQVRMGKDGRVFTMYKLRSMRLDAEKGVGPVWASSSDARVTWLGKWLRKLHLDELPQIFNVVTGEMSLIGPRPERPEFVSVLAEKIPGYCDRLAVLPGVTGLAQINLPPDQTLDDVERKLVLDREYIASAGFWLDLRMLVCTALRMFGVPGAAATRMTQVERRVELPPSEIDYGALGADNPERTPAEIAGTLGVVLANPTLAKGNGHNEHGPHHRSNGRNGNGHYQGIPHQNGVSARTGEEECVQRKTPK